MSAIVQPREFLDDYAIGDRIMSPGRTITEADIHAFAALTGDWNQLHTDREFAGAGPFGERIAHGMLVLAVGSVLSMRLGDGILAPRSLIANVGLDQLRFSNPVRLQDTIRHTAVVTDIVEKNKGRGILVMQNEIINQRDEVCCSYITNYLCGYRPG